MPRLLTMLKSSVHFSLVFKKMGYRVRNTLVRLKRSFIIHIGYRVFSIFKILSDIELNILINTKTFQGDGIITSNFLPINYDPSLSESFDNTFDNLPEDQLRLKKIIWRAHIVTASAHFVSKIKGDFVELGVNWGILAHTISSQSKLLENRNFFLVDAFGLPGFSMKGQHKIHSYREDIYAEVKLRFEFEPRVKLIRGVIPQVLSLLPSKEIAFLLVDLNHGLPERQSLEYLWERIQPGGIVYFDDYGQDFPELRVEIDSFLQYKNEKLLIFPTGQAILIKQ